MAQKPLKKVKLLKKETKYKKMTRKAKSESQILTKEINKAILEKFQAISRNSASGRRPRTSKKLL
jgi:hypothetical protein